MRTGAEMSAPPPPGTSLLFYVPEDYLPGEGTTHSGLRPSHKECPVDQYDGAIFFNWYSLFLDDSILCQPDKKQKQIKNKNKPAQGVGVCVPTMTVVSYSLELELLASVSHLM